MEAAMGSRFVDSILVFLFEFRTNSKQVSCYSLICTKPTPNFHQFFPNFSQNLGRPENGETVQKV